MPFTLPNTIDAGTEIVAAELEGNFQAVKTALNTTMIRADGTVAMTAELPLSGAPTTALSAATKAYVDSFMPIQFAYPCFSPAAPAGFVFPTGQTYARTAAPLMAAAIAPDASSPYWVDATNFKYPDMRDRVPVGKGTVRTVLDEKIGSKDAVVISHAHTVNAHSHVQQGSFTSGNESTTHTHTEGTYWTHGSGTFYLNLSGYVNGFSVLSNGIGGTQTGGQSTNHTHSTTISGSTQNTSPGTDTQGVAGTNLNYQPSIVCNWAMRLA